MHTFTGSRNTSVTDDVKRDILQLSIGGKSSVSANCVIHITHFHASHYRVVYGIACTVNITTAHTLVRGFSQSAQIEAMSTEIWWGDIQKVDMGTTFLIMRWLRFGNHLTQIRKHVFWQQMYAFDPQKSRSCLQNSLYSQQKSWLHSEIGPDACSTAGLRRQWAQCRSGWARHRSRRQAWAGSGTSPPRRTVVTALVRGETQHEGLFKIGRA